MSNLLEFFWVMDDTIYITQLSVETREYEMKKVKINQKAEALKALKAIKDGEALFSGLYHQQYNSVVNNPSAKTDRPTTDLARNIAYTIYRELVNKHGNDCLFVNRLGNTFRFETVIDSLRRVIQNEIKKDRESRVEIKPDKGWGKTIIVPE